MFGILKIELRLKDLLLALLKDWRADFMKCRREEDG